VNLAVFEGLEVVRIEGDLRERFPAGSLSKPVAALTALRLVSTGALELDQEVNAQLRSWQLPQGEGVTLRRLLGHTAGLGVPFFPGYGPGEEVPTLVQVLDGTPPASTAPVRVEAPPGSGFRYSGGGYVLVQLLVEGVTGRPFTDVAAELVLEPLEMARSTFAAGTDHVYPEQAAAGLSTTVEDLARFAIELQRDVDGAAAMLAPHVELPEEGEWTVLRDLGVEPPARAGLGLFLSDGWFSHLGGAFDSFSALWGSLDDRRGVVAQTAGGATPEFFQRLAAATEGIAV
jgi:CubicO group peptidase (beta-lactamase class C family)